MDVSRAYVYQNFIMNTLFTSIELLTGIDIDNTGVRSETWTPLMNSGMEPSLELTNSSLCMN